MANFGGLFAFISASSFVLIGGLGLSRTEFAYSFAVMVAGYCTGATTSGRLVQRVGAARLMRRGALLAAVSGIGMLIATQAFPVSLAAILIPQFFYSVTVGLVMPNAMAGAIQPYPRRAGAASALLGFCQMGAAAATGAAVGQFTRTGALPMALAVAVCGILSLLAERLKSSAQHEIARKSGSLPDRPEA